MTNIPAAAPRGRHSITVQTSLAHGRTRHRLWMWGDDPRVINPGDLLIETVVGDQSALVTSVVYFSGAEVAQLAEVALACAAERDRARWLHEPATVERAA